jgi:hypothetical protein
MRLLGKDISPEKVMAYVGERLASRGLLVTAKDTALARDVEAPVDAFRFNLDALIEHADPTKPLPAETHRGGLSGFAVIATKSVFRRVGQIFINETLSRQRVFNGHVRDSYAQLSAELVRLRRQVRELEGERAAPKLKVKSATKKSKR